MPPYFESLNNGQKLTVMSFVLSFGRNHFTQEVGHQMPLAKVICWLLQHSTNIMPQRVSFNSDVLFQIEMLKDRCFNKGLM